jgi:hypothetical protein
MNYDFSLESHHIPSVNHSYKSSETFSGFNDRSEICIGVDSWWGGQVCRKIICHDRRLFA